MVASRSFFFDKIAEIYGTTEEIESEVDNYSFAFSDAQQIQSLANELDIELTKFFNKLHTFLRELKKGNIDEKELELLLYALEH